MLIEYNASDKNLTSMPKIPAHAASYFKCENCTTCAMHQLGLGCTKSMIEDIGTMTRLVVNVKNLRNKVNECIGMIQKIRSKHINLEF